jgi:hypothetical protein
MTTGSRGERLRVYLTRTRRTALQQEIEHQRLVCRLALYVWHRPALATGRPLLAAPSVPPCSVASRAVYAVCDAAVPLTRPAAGGRRATREQETLQQTPVVVWDERRQVHAPSAGRYSWRRISGSKIGHFRSG